MSDMTEIREEMLDAVIRLKGFEDKDTIYFAQLVANPNEADYAIKIAYNNIMTGDFDFDKGEDEE